MKGTLFVTNNNDTISLSILISLRDKWFNTSYLLDRRQCGTELALERFQNYKNHELEIQI